MGKFKVGDSAYFINCVSVSDVRNCGKQQLIKVDSGKYFIDSSFYMDLDYIKKHCCIKKSLKEWLKYKKRILYLRVNRKIKRMLGIKVYG